MSDKTKLPLFGPEDAGEIARYWRKAWTDLRQKELAAGSSQGFVLWRSVSDGRDNPGTFYTRQKVFDVISDQEMTLSIDKLIDEVDQTKSIVVVLGFEREGRATVVTVDMLNAPREKEWFEMPEIRRRSAARAVWVPLRASQELIKEGRYGYEGYTDEYLGVGTVMFPVGSHDKAIECEWMDIGLSNHFVGGRETEYFQPGSVLDSKNLFRFRIPGTGKFVQAQVDTPSTEAREETQYMPCGDFVDHKSKSKGTGLVIDQSTNSEERTVWHLHQDFVVSLGLIREGDIWLRPDEGYVEVARLARNVVGNPVLIEVRAEHLRDYLCARGMNLYISSYRSRVEVQSDRSHISWDPIPLREETDIERWEGRVSEIHEGGTPFGAETAVMHVARTDVDEEEDVPTFEFPTDDSVETKSWTKKETGRKLYRIEGELWRTEVIEAGSISERVLWQEPPASIEFIVDASGKKETRDTLEHGSRWLWFKPDVVKSILRQRGSSLSWYTRDTGQIGMLPGEGVHFGVNSLGLVNVYAKDVALLPDWQQRVWAGFNVAPDGKVSKELLDSQMLTKPARTQAPEAYFGRAYDAVNDMLSVKVGRPLFRAHQADDVLFQAIHRFRALDRDGLFELAKDIARLTIESIDRRSLAQIIEPAKGETWGSIKHLEEVLGTMIDSDDARRLTGVLAGINELRQADAHMPSSDLGDSIKLAGISSTGLPVDEARQMLHELVDSLYQIADVIRDS